MPSDLSNSSSTQGAARPRRPRGSRGRNALDVYLDRAGRYPRLTAEQEREQLLGLAQLRRLRWEALLSEPSAHAEVLRIIESELPQSSEALRDECTRCARALRRSDSEEARASYDRSNAALAVELEVLDADGKLAERLIGGLPTDGLDAEAAEQYRQRAQRSGLVYRHARNRFVCANLRLVLRVADRYSDRWMPLVDRVQEGNLGLIKAVERFDPERGTRFSTYAVWWIRHHISRALMNRGRTVRVPANLHMIYTKVRRARAQFEALRGRPGSAEEIAAELDLPFDRVAAAIEALELRSVSLGADTETQSPGAFGVPAPQQSIDEHFDQERAMALARRAMQTLAPRDRDIIEQRFALGEQPRVTLEALGRCYRISRERVRQLQNRALKTIRREVESSPTPSLAYA